MKTNPTLFDDPKVMKAAAEPIGPGNDEALSYRSTQVGLIIAAWGNHCDPARVGQIRGLIDKPIMCLGQNKNGSPKHPLYLKADTKPQKFS